MAQRVSPCGWVPNAPCSVGPCCPDTTDPIIKARAEAIAASILWRLTGLQFGCCELTVRPCKPITCDPLTLSQIIYWDQRISNNRTNLGVLSYFPTLLNGQIFNISCGCPTGCCTCKADCEFPLPGPVCEVIDVIVDGQHLGKHLYTVYDDRGLVFANRGTKVHHDLTGPALPAPITLFSGGALTAASSPQGNSVELSGIGTTYDFLLTATPFQGPEDVQWVMEMPIGGGPYSFQVFQPQGFDVIALDGNPTVTVVGSLVTVGSAQEPNTAPRVLIRAPKGSTNVSDIIINQTAGLFGVRIVNVEWTDPSTGSGYCPPCQDYNKAAGQTGTWSVTYTLGTPVPDELNFAAGLYACQIALAMVGDKACTLPSRVQSVSRQGITESFWDPILLTEAGLTGIPLVDEIIKALNPYGMRQPSRVWYPGMAVTRRETQ